VLGLGQVRATSDIISLYISFLCYSKNRLLSTFLSCNNLINVRSIQQPKLWGAGLCHKYLNKIFVQRKINGDCCMIINNILFDQTLSEIENLLNFGTLPDLCLAPWTAQSLGARLTGDKSLISVL